jgi:hypothetical protein
MPDLFSQLKGVFTPGALSPDQFIATAFPAPDTPPAIEIVDL